MHRWGKKIALFLVGVVLVATPAFVDAQQKIEELAGTSLQKTADVAGQGVGLNLKKSLGETIGDVLAAALSLVSIVFFIMMVYGGIKWMLARGNEDTAQKAKDMIIAAIIGLLVVMGSYAITTFIFGSVK